MAFAELFTCLTLALILRMYCQKASSSQPHEARLGEPTRITTTGSQATNSPQGAPKPSRDAPLPPKSKSLKTDSKDSKAHPK